MGKIVGRKAEEARKTERESREEEGICGERTNYLVAT